MSEPSDPGTLPTLGDERVLTALARTMAPIGSVDLAPRPSDAVSSEHRYTELGLLGRGGLGEVMEAFDEDLRRAVALKRPRQDRLGPVAVASLVREAQITAQLDHPNIPPVHTLGIDADGRPYFTMARLRGDTLGELLSRRRDEPELRARLTRGRLLRIFAQVTYAVAFAHDRGVLHRDLKPSNIMIGEFGEVRLMDWGIAKLLREKGDDSGGAAQMGPRPETTTSLETSEGSFVGTPGYASPEQVEGRADVDHRSDIYALGALLYELIAGRPHFAGKNLPEILDDTREGRIRPLGSVTPVSAPLSAIVHKALARDPTERYGSALELVADLEAMQEGRAVSALVEHGVSRAKRWYMARSPRVGRLRNVDVDMLSWSSYVLGIASGGLAVLLGFTWHVGAWWLYALAALGFGIPPLYTLLRPDRPDDPGHAFTFGEGAVTSTGRTPRTAATTRLATPEEAAPTEAAPRDPDSR